MRVGVLSFQGSVIEHMTTLSKIEGVTPVAVKTAAALQSVDRLILPGGESTTISKLLHIFDMFAPLKKRIEDGMPVWGTCAGMVLLAKEIIGEIPHLGLMDISVRRNAYGSQLDSFVVDKFIPAVGHTIPLVFIRAPFAESAGASAEVLLELNGKIVAARQKNMLATSFHPELTTSTLFHEFFVNSKNFIV